MGLVYVDAIVKHGVKSIKIDFWLILEPLILC